MFMRTTSRKTKFCTVLIFTCSLLFAIIGCGVKTQNDGTASSSSRLDIGVAAAYAEDAEQWLETVTRKRNTDTYTVFCNTYHLLSSSADYSAQGMAFWYGSKFHGKRTSNCKIYDLKVITAAHKTSPKRCYVRKINRQNGRYSVVSGNDRGPFHGDRLIDLSYAVTVRFGSPERGTAPAFIETTLYLEI